VAVCGSPLAGRIPGAGLDGRGAVTSNIRSYGRGGRRRLWHLCRPSQTSNAPRRRSAGREPIPGSALVRRSAMTTLMLAWTAAAAAQTTTATIEGTVSDATGALLPAVAIIVEGDTIARSVVRTGQAWRGAPSATMTGGSIPPCAKPSQRVRSWT
jgi:hypothetical protein